MTAVHCSRFRSAIAKVRHRMPNPNPIPNTNAIPNPNPIPNPDPNPIPNPNFNPNPNPNYAGPSLWRTFAMAALRYGGPVPYKQ